jgi:tRNA threonylcarbamoyladenosine biosynthesis protein TsaB
MKTLFDFHAFCVANEGFCILTFLFLKTVLISENQCQNIQCQSAVNHSSSIFLCVFGGLPFIALRRRVLCVKIILEMKNEKPLILAVETSGRLGSVAIALGDKLLAEKQFTGPMRHSAEVFPAIVGLLEKFNKKPAHIEQVHISIGPGSFTGLRIAVTIAKSMALANHSKIVAVDTLDCIAANVLNLTAEHAETADKELRLNERLGVILDAKRGQFFIALYEKTQDSIWEKTLSDCLLTADEFRGKFADEANPVALIGEGLVFYKDKFACPGIRVLDEKFWNPSAAKVHKLGWQKALAGEFTDPLTLVPNYLRGPDVETKIK